MIISHQNDFYFIGIAFILSLFIRNNNCLSANDALCGNKDKNQCSIYSFIIILIKNIYMYIYIYLLCCSDLVNIKKLIYFLKTDINL